MATSGYTSPVSEEPTTDMSDEVREMFCEPCRAEGIDVRAHGFCVKCMDYLCTTCLKYHRKLKSKHVLQDETSMPRDFCFEKCKKHQAEIIKFYCEKCDLFMCSTCVNTDHKYCSEAKHLPTIVNDIENGTELKAVTDELARQREEMSKCNKKQISNYEEVERNRNWIKSAIKKHRKELNDKLDHLEEKLDSEVEKIKKNDKVLNKSVSGKHKSLTIEFKLLQSELNSASGDRCKLFMAMKKAQKELIPTEMRIKSMLEENKVIRYIFQPSDRTKALLDLTDTFGSLVVNDSKRKRLAANESDIIVKSQDDKETCDIVGICVMSENCLIVTDFQNKNLKLVDQKQNVIRSVLPLDTTPWDVCKVSDEEIAVTLINKGTILFIIVKECASLSKLRDIKVKGECRGVEYSHGNLLVSFIKPAKIEILDMTGAVLQTFLKDISGNDLFTGPLYFALKYDHSAIYVSDFKNNSITSLSRSGDIDTIYKKKELGRFVGITTDETGTVYYCANGANKVYQLSDELSEIQVLLDSTHKVIQPYCCAICNRTNRLYVGIDKQDYIKVFTLT